MLEIEDAFVQGLAAVAGAAAQHLQAQAAKQRQGAAMSGLSELSRLFLEKWNLLAAAEGLLWDELRRLSEEAAATLTERRWVCVVYRNASRGYLRLRMRRPPWPTGEDLSVYFQAGLDHTWLARGPLHFHLDAEGSSLAQRTTAQWLRQLLQKYELTGNLLRQASARLRRKSPQRLLRATLPLIGLSSEKLVEALTNLAQVESMATEALFVAGKTELWGTDFLPGDPLPLALQTDGGPAEKVILEPAPGRLSTACRCLEQSATCPLAALEQAHGGRRLWVAVCARSSKGAVLGAWTGDKVHQASQTRRPADVAEVRGETWQHIVLQLSGPDDMAMPHRSEPVVVGLTTMRGEVYVDGISLLVERG